MASTTVGLGSNESVAMGSASEVKPEAPTCRVEGKLAWSNIGEVVSRMAKVRLMVPVLLELSVAVQRTD